MKCKWLNENRFLNIILTELKNKQLPTPYNIYAFTLLTGLNNDNYYIDNEDHLKKIIHRYSQRTAETFATNIRDINKDEYYKILYACFPFISDEFPKSYVERKLKQIIDEKNPNEKEYNKYKFLEASQYHYGTIISSPTIQFVHPSLSEALPYLLMRNNLSKPDIYIQDLFSKVLVYLGYDPINLETTCYFILKNYEILVNEDVKNLLNKVMDSKDFKYGIFNEVFANFDKIENH